MFVRLYLRSVALLLLIAAVGKLFMVSGSAAALNEAAPSIFSFMSYRDLLLIAAAVELLVAVFVLKRTMQPVSALLAVSTLATILVCYRVFLKAVGIEGPCDCLGDLGPIKGAPIATGILCYAFIGSYGFLLKHLFFSNAPRAAATLGSVTVGTGAN